MFEAVGYLVDKLKRERVAFLTTDNLNKFIKEKEEFIVAEAKATKSGIVLSKKNYKSY